MYKLILRDIQFLILPLVSILPLYFIQQKMKKCCLFYGLQQPKIKKNKKL